MVDLAQPVDVASVQEWISTNKIENLNVAGPRASQQPDVYKQAVVFLREVLKTT